MAFPVQLLAQNVLDNSVTLCSSLRTMARPNSDDSWSEVSSPGDEKPLRTLHVYLAFYVTGRHCSEIDKMVLCSNETPTVADVLNMVNTYLDTRGDSPPRTCDGLSYKDYTLFNSPECPLKAFGIPLTDDSDVLDRIIKVGISSNPKGMGKGWVDPVLPSVPKGAGKSTKTS